MGDGLSPEDERAASHPPPTEARTWRHPSELGAPARHPAAPAAAERGAHGRGPAERRPDGRRFSAASLLLAGAAGAFAMLVALVATGSLGAPRGSDERGGLIDAAIDSRAALTPADGIVTIRFDGDGEQHHRVGLVVDHHGDIVTAADPGDASDDSTLDRSALEGPGAALSVRTVDGAWVPAEFVGADERTGLSVIRIAGDAATQPAATAPVTLGDGVRLARASSTSDPIVVSAGRTERIVGLNTSIRRSGTAIVGLATFTSDLPAHQVDLVVSANDGRVVGLVSPADEHRSDALSHAVPAATAVRVGRQIALDGAPSHGRLDAGVTAGAGGVVVTEVGPDTNAARAGLLPGDQIESLAGQPIDSIDDLAGALLTRAETAVEIAVLRSGERLTRAIEPVRALAAQAPA